MPGQHPELQNALHDFRTAAGLTQGELAEKVGVSRKSVNKIENGVFIPSTVLAFRLARVLNCQVEALFQLPEG